MTTETPRGRNLADRYSRQIMTESLTIAIPSFQRRLPLAILLESIRASLDPPLDTQLEVVVVLDGSTDGSEKMVNELADGYPVPLRAAWKPNGGLASARNAAIEQARGQLVWLVDDDMTVTRRALDHHLGHDRSAAPVLMGPCVVPTDVDGSDDIRAFYERRHERLAARGEVATAADCSFANTSAPRELLSRYPFDEGFRGYGMEDYDLGARLLAAGHHIAFAPGAAIAHHATPSRGERLEKLRQEGANRLRFVRCHPNLHAAAFTGEPARFERVARALARPSMAKSLWALSRAIERAAVTPVLRRHRARLEYWADTCAVYSGVAGAAQDADLAITIVIPTYDAATTIEGLLSNIAAQTSASWEAIVVDDGSTDRTAEIVERRALRDSRIRLLRQPRAGVGAARNAGRKAASCAWLLFMDADDRIAEGFVERMQRALRENSHADAVRCNWAYEVAGGRIEVVPNAQLDDGADLFDVAAERSPFAIHSCVVRASLVDEVGGFDTGLRVGEDWDLWQRIARTGGRLVSVPDVLSFYVLRPDSAMRRDSRAAVLDALTVYRRGHSPDSRVPRQLDRYRDGASLPSGRDVVAERVAWDVGVGVAAGVDVTASLPAHSPPLDAWLDPLVVAGTLYEAVPFGCCALTSDWPSIWAQQSSAIVSAVDALGQWSGHAGITARVLRHLEKMVLLHSSERGALTVGASFGVRVDLAATMPAVALDDGVQRVIARVVVADAPLGIAEIPVLQNALDSGQVRRAVRRQLGGRFAWVSLRRPRLAWGMVHAFADPGWLMMPARLAMDLPLGDRVASRDIATRFLHAFAGRAAASSPLLALSAPETEPGNVGRLPVDSPHGVANGAEYFEDIFSIEDPWGYTSPYEQTKYEQTLSLLGGQRAGSALELACAEGHFTLQLAPAVGRLIAADISPTALARAKQRCALLDNVDFQLIDLRADDLPNALDLIVCSEVLYFLDDEAALRSVAARFVAALNPGGRLVTAHATITRDDPAITAFPWDRPFGAKRIGEILGSTDGLRLRREIVTPLYRIQLFERVDEPAAPPVVEYREHAAELDPQMRRSIAWGGVTVTRSDAMATEITNLLPIFMYHRVSESGPVQLDRYRVDPAAFEQQLDHLRRHGYYGVTAARWAMAVEQHRALPGRAVMLTFDDGYRDFLEHAFPLLDAYGFAATVFVVPDHVGGRAEWDSEIAEPATLLSWAEIAHLTARGIEFGSHSGAHVRLSDLSPRDALQQERRARNRLRAQLDQPVTTVAYPFGVHDAVIRATMEEAGYRLGFTSTHGLASVWDDPLALPRIEVRGDEDLDAFAAKLPLTTQRNPMHGHVERARSAARRALNWTR